MVIAKTRIDDHIPESRTESCTTTAKRHRELRHVVIGQRRCDERLETLLRCVVVPPTTDEYDGQASLLDTASLRSQCESYCQQKHGVKKAGSLNVSWMRRRNWKRFQVARPIRQTRRPQINMQIITAQNLFVARWVSRSSVDVCGAVLAVSHSNWGLVHLRNRGEFVARSFCSSSGMCRLESVNCPWPLRVWGPFNARLREQYVTWSFFAGKTTMDELGFRVVWLSCCTCRSRSLSCSSVLGWSGAGYTCAVGRICIILPVIPEDLLGEVVGQLFRPGESTVGELLIGAFPRGSRYPYLLCSLGLGDRCQGDLGWGKF